MREFAKHLPISQSLAERRAGAIAHFLRPPYMSYWAPVVPLVELNPIESPPNS